MSPVAKSLAARLAFVLLAGCAVARVFAGDCVHDRSRAWAWSRGLGAAGVAGVAVLLILHGV